MPEALCSNRQQKTVHNGPRSNGACHSCVTSVCWSSPVTQVTCLLYAPIGLNPALTSIKNGQCHQMMASIYIYISKSLSPGSSRLSPTRFRVVSDRLMCWVFEFVTEVRQEHLIKCRTTSADLRRMMPLAPIPCLLFPPSLLMAWFLLWVGTEGPLTAFRLICSPSSSLTLHHDNLVSRSLGEDGGSVIPENWQCTFLCPYKCCLMCPLYRAVSVGSKFTSKNVSLFKETI